MKLRVNMPRSSPVNRGQSKLHSTRKTAWSGSTSSPRCRLAGSTRTIGMITTSNISTDVVDLIQPLASGLYLTNDPPAKPGGFEREPLKAAVLWAAHERPVSHLKVALDPTADGAGRPAGSRARLSRRS